MMQAFQTMTPEQWQIVIVRSVIERGNFFQVSFQAGLQATISTFHPEWQTIQQWLSFSLRHRCLIGACLEGNQLVKAGMIDLNDIGEVSDSPRYPHLVSITFRGCPAPVYLPRDHPRYQDMLADITQSVAAEQPIWCALQGSSIAAVKLFREAEDEAFWQWIQHAQGAEP